MATNTEFPPAPTVQAASAEPRWSVRLLGGIEAAGPSHTISRWPSRAVAALLARLALAPDRAHPREELVELLWPGVDLEVGRNRLRQALSTLKSLLEPANAPKVLLADRMHVRVVPGTIHSDARHFEQLARAGNRPAALATYRGELMPGFYEDWVGQERQRLANVFERLEAMPAAAVAPPMPDAPAGQIALAPTGLPSYWTRAFGVELTASRLRALVRAQRLITVHGPGGSGKTRLAVEVAQALRDSPPWAIGSDGAAPRLDRIAFVPIIDCTSAAQVLDAICIALHVDGGGERRQRIVAALSGRQALLVLDNADQVVEQAGVEIASLLSSLPTLHVMVTSRRLLEVDGEHAFELEGLPSPMPEASLADIAANPAVSLFVDRARAARSAFRLSERHATAVSRLVRLLGGMPLAIELAASRVRGLAPQELLQRLSADAGSPMLDLLARNGARASADARHASMRHVIDWSWRQVSASGVELLQAMSVCAAPVRLEAVAALAGLDAHATQALLDELRDASLVTLEEGEDGVWRYRLLQPVREFAAEGHAPDSARAARRRMRRWLTAFAVEAVKQGPAAVAPEVVHVHAAIVSAPADGASRDALELAVALRPYWDSDYPPLSSLRALEQGLADIDDTDLRADTEELLAFGLSMAGLVAEAVTHAEAALAVTQDDRRRSLALVRWGWSMYYAGRYGTSFDAALDEAAELSRRSGDLVAQASVLRLQALIASNLHFDFAGAEKLIVRSRPLWELAGHRSMAQFALLNQATMWAWLGRNDEALVVFGECERATRANGDWAGLMFATRQTGRVLIRLRRWDDAAAAFRRSIRAAWQRHSTQGVAHGLLHLPEALAMIGQAPAAGRLQGFAVAHWMRLYVGINPIEARELVRARRMLRLHLGAPRAEALRLEGSALNVVQAVALALEGTGEV